MRNFAEWLSKFKASISDYGYYIDFDKIYRNVDAMKVELNILNSLIGSKDIETEFEQLLVRYPETLKCIPILLAIREREIYAIDGDGEFTYSFRKANYGIEQYKTFMRKTGLFNLMQNHILSNLVESYLQKAGLIKDKTYFKEMKTDAIESRWGLELSILSNQGKTVKRFDFVVRTTNNVYGVETNFYTSSGSKLNETARSYKNIAIEAKEIDGFDFVWFTDGRGWTSARHNLEETFDVMEHIYSIDDMENGVMNRVFV